MTVQHLLIIIMTQEQNAWESTCYKILQLLVLSQYKRENHKQKAHLY